MTQERSRGGFVRLDRKAAAELQRRLEHSDSPPSTQGRAELAANRLLREADHRDDRLGHVEGNKTAIAALIGATPKTAKVIRGVLAYIGLLNPGGDDFHITRAAYAWLTRGEPAPPSLGEMQRDPAHALWLFIQAESGATARLEADEIRSRSGSEKWEPLPVEVGAAPSRSGSRSHFSSPPPAETAPKEVKKERTPPAPPRGAAEEVITALARARPQASDATTSPALREAVDRLLGDGWPDGDIVSAVLDRAGPGARTGLLVVKAKELLGTEPPQQAKSRQAAATAAKQAAPDCQEHGTPNGTWEGDGQYSPGWVACAQCRATSTRAPAEASPGWANLA